MKLENEEWTNENANTQTHGNWLAHSLLHTQKQIQSVNDRDEKLVWIEKRWRK